MTNSPRRQRHPAGSLPLIQRLLLVCSVAAISFGTTSVCCSQATTPFTLQDVTDQTGITFRHTDGHSGQRYIVENVCSGLAIFDYDGDGLEDIYFLNGGMLKGTKADPPPRNALYRNLGDWKFQDVTESAGVGDTGHSLGVAAADYDNDGDIDLYVNNFGPNVLYRNEGQGHFVDATAEAGVANGDRVGSGVCFLDVDQDGLLDLFVSSYVQFSYANHKPRSRAGIASYPGPLEYSPEGDRLYRNNGDGSFSDITEVSGIGNSQGKGMGVVCCDCDNDGDTDIFVGNDVMENFLFVNDGKGHFSEDGLFNGVAVNYGGTQQGSMGVACADYDNDGDFDFHVTTAAQELSTLYRNFGDGTFDDRTRETGAGSGTKPHVAWGNEFVDFDNDGYRDLFIACGHFDDNAEKRDDTTAYRVRNVVLMNDGGNRFVDVSATSGSGMLPEWSSRGAAFEDLDNDGDIDAVVLNTREKPTVIRNETIRKDTNNSGHWIQIRLRGTKSNRDGVGARVKITAGDLVQIDEVRSGRGYQSHYGMRLHFGLGTHQTIDQIEVRWPSGKVQQLSEAERAIDSCLTIVETE